RRRLLAPPHSRSYMEQHLVPPLRLRRHQLHPSLVLRHLRRARLMDRRLHLHDLPQPFKGLRSRAKIIPHPCYEFLLCRSSGIGYLPSQCVRRSAPLLFFLSAFSRLHHHSTHNRSSFRRASSSLAHLHTPRPSYSTSAASSPERHPPPQKSRPLRKSST